MYVNSILDRNNRTEELNELVRILFELAIYDIKEQGVKPLILETYRSQQRQNYLYCQGRTVSEVMKKGISKSFAESHCNPKVAKVTWTVNSLHKQRKAVDIVPVRKIDGEWTAIWNAKDKQTLIIINTMQEYGFEAGANWVNNPDSPHFQVNGSFDRVFKQGSNTTYVTKTIQKALNKKAKTKLKVDGLWGPKTTEAVNKFRKQQGYKLINGQLGAIALKALLV